MADAADEGSNQTTAPPQGDDALVAALDELSGVVAGVVRDAREVDREIGRVRHRRLRGASAREAVFSGGTGSRLMSGLDRMASRLTTAGGAIRRVVVRAMLGEGERVTGIARLLGVSHQRISALGRDGTRHR